MSDATALAEIHRLAALPNRIRYRRHAYQRMAERGASRDDVQNALLTATDATWQAQHQTFLVSGGLDLRGDDLVCAVDLEDDVIVVTIF